MLPISRMSTHQLHSTDISDSQALVTKDIARNIAREDIGSNHSKIAPQIPRSLSINGKLYPMRSLKGRIGFQEKAYLAAVLEDMSSVSADKDQNTFSYNKAVRLPNSSVGEELSVKLHLDSQKAIAKIVINNLSSADKSFAVEVDNSSQLGAKLHMQLTPPDPQIPEAAMYDGGELPRHPGGELYKVMSLVSPGIAESLKLTGLMNGKKFDVYDVKSHELLAKLPTIDIPGGDSGDKSSKALTLPSHQKLVGGMRHFKNLASGVKTSKSSPTGYKKNGEPCDRHGRPVAAAGASAGESSSSAAYQPLRSALRKNVEQGLKQYVLDGKRIGPRYAIKQPGQEIPAEPTLLSSTYASAIYQRRNPASPYIKKVKAAVGGDVESQHRIRVRNKIVKLVEGNKRAKHFVVEIFSGESNGNFEYIARKVNGVSLDNLATINALRQEGSITDEQLGSMFDELGKAVDWLNSSGYYHNDIQLSNIMLDYDSGVLALIDFEKADNSELYGRSNERPQLDLLKNNYI